jgi:hypothetical protein
MVRLEEGEEKKIFVGMEEHPMPRPAFRGHRNTLNISKVRTTNQIKG